MKQPLRTWVFITYALLITTTLSFIKLSIAQEETDENNAEEEETFVFSASSTADLFYDENDRLAHHTLVYPAGKCAEIIKEQNIMDQYGFEFFSVENDAMRDFFPTIDDASSLAEAASISDCPAICLERGVEKSLITFPTEQRRYNSSKDEDFFPWFNEQCTEMEICFVNYYNNNDPLDVFWVSHDGERVPNSVVDYGERKTKCFSSFLGHAFEIVDRASNEVVNTLKVEFTANVPTGQDPPHGTFDEERVPHNVKNTLKWEWKRHLNVKRTFTPLGFKKGRLPPDLFGSMGAFYYNNRPYIVREEWGGKGLFVNWWESEIKFIAVPWNLKHAWQHQLRMLVEEWVGVELEQTDMYGMRQYEEGSRLLTHVDRETTHATSLIVNIAQGNVEEPWPVEVHDHAGRLHQVPMEPGDIVYYESAACLHGRNTPLKGEGAYYVNLFTHYRPTGDPDWLFRENPEGTPERLVDVGECRLREGMEGRVGVGAVTCENEAVGPYLSPDLLTARSGDDLFQWWLKVGPQKIRDYMERKEQKEDVVPQEKADESNANQEDEDDDEDDDDETSIENENEDDDDETSIENENEADAEEL